MATIITREIGATAKGSPLTNAELDQNFINLNTNNVELTDIGTAPNEVPLNQYLGELAYMDADKLPTIGVATANLSTANITNLMQVTDIGTVMPTLNLDFARVKQLDPRITFSRASTATYYDGKATAKAEENLLPTSQEFVLNAGWASARVTTSQNTTTAPDGTTTADSLIEDNTASNTHTIFWGPTTMLVIGRPYVVSVFAKKNTRDQIFIRRVGSPNFGADGCLFDLTAGTVSNVGTGATGSIVSVGNDWYRCIVTCINAEAQANPAHFALAVAGNTSYTGNGTSGLFLWGAQLEQRSAATAYTPTTTQPITNYIPQLLTAASGVARFDHNPTTFESLGLLIEEQRTNLLLQSEEFDNAAWAKSNVTVTANATVAPDGTTTADKLVENTATAFHYVLPAASVSVTSGTLITTSVYAKAAERTGLGLFPYSSAAGARFNLTNGTIISQEAGVTASIINAGNGWYRCSASITAPAGSAAPWILPLGPSNATNYTGNGYSGLFIWGAQVEAGAFATSYIPTVASQVTRAADVAVMTGTNFSSWYNQAEGTIFAESILAQYCPAGRFGQCVWQADDGTGNNRTHVRNDAASTTYLFRSINVDGVNATIGLAFSLNAPVKTALAYKVNDFNASLGGGVGITDTLVNPPVVNTFRLGQENAGLWLNGHIRRIAYYPQRLGNAELVELTA